METLSLKDQIFRRRPMVPICSRLLHTPSITGPSPWLAAGEEGNRRHISLCGSHLLHYRMHAAHKSTPCKLQPLEAPHFCPDTVFPRHVCYRMRCRQPMRDKPRLHGCRAPSRHDIHRMCANHHLFQCYNDEASEWQSSFDRGTIYAGQFSWAVHIAITNVNVYEYWSLGHKSSTRSWIRGLW